MIQRLDSYIDYQDIFAEYMATRKRIVKRKFNKTQIESYIDSHIPVSTFLIKKSHPGIRQILCHLSFCEHKSIYDYHIRDILLLCFKHLFTKRIQDASRELNMSQATLKRSMRMLGIKYWPHRKLVANTL
jgi:hypothetical protein